MTKITGCGIIDNGEAVFRRYYDIGVDQIA